MQLNTAFNNWRYTNEIQMIIAFDFYSGLQLLDNVLLPGGF